MINNKIRLKPLGDHIVLESVEIENENGFYEARSSNQILEHAVVVELGGLKLQGVSIGTQVIYRTSSGIPTEISGKKYILIHKDDVIAYLDDEKTN